MARSTSVRLDDESEAALDEMVKASGMSAGEIIRSLLKGTWMLTASGAGTATFPTEVQALRASTSLRDGGTVRFTPHGVGV